jgi:hypothetical protein
VYGGNADVQSDARVGALRILSAVNGLRGGEVSVLEFGDQVRKSSETMSMATGDRNYDKLRPILSMTSWGFEATRSFGRAKAFMSTFRYCKAVG